MTNLFLPILKMSAVGSIVILAVIFVRFVLRGAPKIYSYLLWSVAAFRLLCPVTFTSRMSVFNYVKDVPSVPVTETVTDVITETNRNPADIASVIWFWGIVVLIIYSIITYYRLKIRLNDAEHLYDNVYSAEGLPSPFVMGFFSPVIYIPVGLSNEEREYVLKHERVHIRRRDHIIKLFAFGILTIHWFNPLCWLAFILMSRDMEMSCDERVLRDGNSIKIYGNALVSMATATRFPSPGPISFGEVGVKRRVKNILNWKKPAMWITVISVILCIGTVSVFATDAEKKTPEPSVEAEISVSEETTDDTTSDTDTKGTTTVDTKPVDTKPVDTATVDTAPADTTTADTTAADTTAPVPRPKVTKPVYTPTTTQKQTEPPETKVTETKAIETESNIVTDTLPEGETREVGPVDKPDMGIDEAIKNMYKKRDEMKNP